MIIRNGLVLQGREWTRADLQFDTHIIRVGHVDVRDHELDADGCYVIPGLVDIHTHGCVGEDWSDGKADGVQSMADHYAACGVTGFLATTMTLSEERLTAAMHILRDHRHVSGAKCLGAHLEGPFLSAARNGAQAAEHLHSPDCALFARLNEASGGQVRVVTTACEEPGAMEFIRKISQTCTVSIGHTDTNYDTAMGAFSQGASHVTHLYNCMPPLLHRQPGPIGAALDSGASVELICDGIHIHPAVIRATFAMFGSRVVLISDSLRCAGMPDGTYELGGQPVQLQDGIALLQGTQTLAGSTLSLMEAVRNAVRFGVPVEHAVYAASSAPALAAGLTDVGCIEPKKCADLVILDGDLNIKAVFINGTQQVRGIQSHIKQK